MKWLAILLTLLLGGAQAENVSFKYNGTRLQGNLEKSDNWPAGPVVLLTHGTLAHNRMEIITTLQELFAENGISSLAINLSLSLDNRSSSMYDCQIPHTHKHTDAVREIGAWVEWLRFEDVKDIVLLGHSRGGNQTAWYAAEQPDETVSRVILLAPQTWSEKYAAKDYEKRYGKALQPILDKALALVKAGKGKEVLEHVDFIYCKDTSASAEAFVNYYAPDSRMDTPYLLSKIRLPVLLFAGSEDKVVKGLGDKLKKLPGRPQNLEVVIVDGADHFFRDLYAEEVVEKIMETMDKPAE
jgi:pimeloyl-ACP methyl ester carboxylesterase